MQEPTNGVVPGQENLHEVCEDRHLRGERHAWLKAAQNLHTGVRNELKGHTMNVILMT